MRPTSVLATVTGRDRPGVTAAFFAALAAHDVDVRDVEQVVIRGQLVLSVLADLRGDPGALRSSATSAAHALGMECEVTVADETGDAPREQATGRQAHILVIGRPLRPGAVSHVAQRIADLGANIESIAQPSVEPLPTLELLVRIDDQATLRAALAQTAVDTGLDIAVQPASTVRLPKRLVVFSAAIPAEQVTRVAEVSDRLGLQVAVVGEHDLGAGVATVASLEECAAATGVGTEQALAVGAGPDDQRLLAAGGLALVCGARVSEPAEPRIDSVLVVLGAA